MPKLDDVVADILRWLDENKDSPRELRKRMVIHMIQRGLSDTLGRIFARMLLED